MKKHSISSFGGEKSPPYLEESYLLLAQFQIAKARKSDRRGERTERPNDRQGLQKVFDKNGVLYMWESAGRGGEIKSEEREVFRWNCKNQFQKKTFLLMIL